MPFRRYCRITITNEGRRRVANLYYHVDWEKRQTLPPGTAYFHAWYHQEIPAQPGKPYTVLDVRGRGHYVGTVLSVIQTSRDGSVRATTPSMSMASSMPEYRAPAPRTTSTTPGACG